jgi:hypothetical protein
VSPSRPAAGDPTRRYTRIAGVLGLLSIVAGGFGEAYVPATMIVASDATATAANILAREQLWRWGFACYMVEAVCDVGLTLLFLTLLRVVHRELALAAVFFRLIGTSGFAMAQVLLFAALPTIQRADLLHPFDADQRNALAMLLIQISSQAQTVFTMLYGIGTLAFGYLMYRSGFLPSAIGVAVMLAAAGFVVKAVAWVLAPAYSSPILLAPAGAAFLLLSAWLLVVGIDPVAWREQRRRAAEGI